MGHLAEEKYADALSDYLNHRIRVSGERTGASEAAAFKAWFQDYENYEAQHWLRNRSHRDEI